MLPRSGYFKQAEGLASGFSISPASGLKPRSGQDFWRAAPYPEAESMVLRGHANNFRGETGSRCHPAEASISPIQYMRASNAN